MEKKQRTQIIITSFLMVVFIIAWANAIKAIRERSRGSIAPPPAVSAADVFEAPVKEPQRQAPAAAKQKPPGGDNYAAFEWKRCPFSGVLLSDEASMSDLRLNGIIWDETKPQALINNEPYVTGGQVGRYIIVGIFKNKVVLSDGKKEFELLLF